jgi:hypothetical protein
VEKERNERAGRQGLSQSVLGHGTTPRRTRRRSSSVHGEILRAARTCARAAVRRQDRSRPRVATRSLSDTGDPATRRDGRARPHDASRTSSPPQRRPSLGWSLEHRRDLRARYAEP